MVMQFFRQIGDQVNDTTNQISDTIQAVVKGPSRLSASVRQILQDHGDKPILKASIIRTPVSTFVKEALNVVSLGEFKKRLSKQPYDDVFHLFMVLTLSDVSVSLEKNSIITMRVNPDRKGESREAFPSGLTLNKLIEATSQRMGPKFIPYTSKSNNCQNFILNVLRANGMSTPELEIFVKQDTNALFDGILRKFSNVITDLGAKFETVKQGAGHTSLSKATPKGRHGTTFRKATPKGRHGTTFRFHPLTFALLDEGATPCKFQKYSL
jgi:hypothetical protein